MSSQPGNLIPSATIDSVRKAISATTHAQQQRKKQPACTGLLGRADIWELHEAVRSASHHGLDDVPLALLLTLLQLERTAMRPGAWNGQGLAAQLATLIRLVRKAKWTDPAEIHDYIVAMLARRHTQGRRGRIAHAWVLPVAAAAMLVRAEIAYCAALALTTLAEPPFHVRGAGAVMEGKLAAIIEIIFDMITTKVPARLCNCHLLASGGTMRAKTARTHAQRLAAEEMPPAATATEAAATRPERCAQQHSLQAFTVGSCSLRSFLRRAVLGFVSSDRGNLAKAIAGRRSSLISGLLRTGLATVGHELRLADLVLSFRCSCGRSTAQPVCACRLRERYLPGRHTLMAAKGQHSRLYLAGFEQGFFTSVVRCPNPACRHVRPAPPAGTERGAQPCPLCLMTSKQVAEKREAGAFGPDAPKFRTRDFAVYVVWPPDEVIGPLLPEPAPAADR